MRKYQQFAASGTTRENKSKWLGKKADIQEFPGAFEKKE